MIILSQRGEPPPTANESSEGMINMATMTTAEVALELDTDPRTLRKFLRSADAPVDAVGKGSRYAIEKKQIRSLRTKFAKWDEARNADKADDTPETDNEDNSPETPTEG